MAVKPVVPKCSVPKSVPFGKSAELSCVEDEGFPKSQYQWFKNREEIPEDPKISPKFYNSSYTLNADTGTLVSVCACMCLDKDTYEQQGRGSRLWPHAQGWGQIFWGDSWWCEGAWAMRGICCSRLHIPQSSFALQYSSMCLATFRQLSAVSLHATTKMRHTNTHCTYLSFCEFLRQVLQGHWKFPQANEAFVLYSSHFECYF